MLKRLTFAYDWGLVGLSCGTFNAFREVFFGELLILVEPRYKMSVFFEAKPICDKTRELAGEYLGSIRWRRGFFAWIDLARA